MFFVLFSRLRHSRRAEKIKTEGEQWSHIPVIPFSVFQDDFKPV